MPHDHCGAESPIALHLVPEGGEAGEGETVFLPVGSTHSFRVSDARPFRTLQITVPSGFEEFTAEAGTVATSHDLPSPGPIDFAAVGQAAACHSIEIVGPPAAV